MNAFVFGLIGGLGTTEIVLIALLVLVLFGAHKIPQFARGLGEGIREFKSAAHNVKQEVDSETEDVKQHANTDTNTNHRSVPESTHKG